MEPSRYGRLLTLTCIGLPFANLMGYLLISSVYTDIGQYMLIEVIGVSPDFFDSLPPGSRQLTAYLAFLVIPVFGVLLGAVVWFILALRHLVHLLLRLFGRVPGFDIEPLKLFGLILLITCAVGYVTIGFPHAITYPGTRMTGSPLWWNAIMATGGTMMITMTSLAAMLDPGHARKHFETRSSSGS
jgi:hypothetical protein